MGYAKLVFIRFRMMVAAFVRSVVRASFWPSFFLLDRRNADIVRTSGDVLRIESQREARDGTFCVLHVYQRYGLPGYLKRLVTELDRLGVNIVLVHNLPLTDEDRQFLVPHVHTTIGRRNIGRDFGGYRSGVLHILEHYQPGRLLLLNDSMFYAARGLRAFLEALCGDAEFVGAAENYEFAYHVGSYALGFGPAVLADPRFRAFWQNYRLTDLRPSVIRQGELALNRLIIGEIGIRPEVIYGPARLQQALDASDAVFLLGTARQMPPGFGRRDELMKLARRLRQWVLEPNSNLPAGSPVTAMAEMLAATPSSLAAELAQTVVQDLRGAIMDFVVRGSQIHWGALPLMRHLNCPMVKSDLLLRSIYTVGDLGAFAEYLTPDEFAEFHALMTSRGVPDLHWSLKDRLLLSVGYI